MKLWKLFMKNECCLFTCTTSWQLQKISEHILLSLSSNFSENICIYIYLQGEIHQLHYIEIPLRLFYFFDNTEYEIHVQVNQQNIMRLLSSSNDNFERSTLVELWWVKLCFHCFHKHRYVRTYISGSLWTEDHL